MEQIKLVLMILLTLLTYVKLRRGRMKQEELRRNQEKKVMQEEEVVVAEQQLLPEEVEFMSRAEREEINRVESELFGSMGSEQLKQHVKPAKRMDCNDILGGEYSKCRRGATCDMYDALVIYNEGYFSCNPFRNSDGSSFVLKNDEYLCEMREVLNSSFSLEEGKLNRTHCGVQVDSDRSFLEDNLFEKMAQEKMEQESRISTKPIPINKHKFIRKHRRLGTPSKKPMFCARHSNQTASKDTKKKNALKIDLQEEIRKREEEIQILKRLKADHKKK